MRLFYALYFRLSRKHTYKTFAIIDLLEEGADVESYLSKIRAAIDLIEAYDPKRYRRICQDIPTIRIGSNNDVRGLWVEIARTCEMGKLFLASADATPTTVASSIVYTGVQARVYKMRVRRVSGVDLRVTNLAVRQQRDFLRLLPPEQASKSLAGTEWQLAQKGDYWSDEALYAHKISGITQLGFPVWLAKAIVWAFGRRAT